MINSGMNDVDFVVLNDFLPEAIYEIRYFSDYNFVGRRIKGYEEDCALLTHEAAMALREVSDELLSMGYKLKIFDAYRPRTAIEDFIAWSKDLDDIKMKNFFYPNVDKSELFARGYIVEKSSHNRGSTVDLTLINAESRKELDMGGIFDYFDESSQFGYEGLTDEQRKNRDLLRNIMMKHGFMPIEEEWWHFVLKDEPYPDGCFDFPVRIVAK